MKAGDIQRLINIMAQLRNPDGGCPWDLEQTYKTIVPHTIEEAYEVADAIERESYQELKDELGDLLFQVVFYAQLAGEEKRFGFDDIVAGVCDKLERRHPHVFGDKQVADADEQTRHWEQLKADERKASAGQQAHSVLDGIAHTLPGLTLAHKLQKRAAQVGFDWPDEQGVFDKVTEELEEAREAWSNPDQRVEEIGDLLFSCVNLARHAGVDAETTLRQANRKFESRFRSMEQQLAQDGKELQQSSADEMEKVWESVKDQARK
ncbi:MAG: nucleoside triphosphate pyrophosphohydrolase [Gammaproteobacteria bacterium]|nr:nucleoside triphosphate pyrophosphohydrolase [Gammaproteobacteria bacterium]